jgi:uroporphyrinogen-III synthase
VLSEIEDRAGEQPLKGARVAIQEYGVTNAELVAALTARGAQVRLVPVYRWALPEDVAPLKEAVTAIAGGRIDVAMFTTGVQVVHLWQIVTEMKLETQVRAGLARAVIGSIGPSTSDQLRQHDLAVDLEASHPKFGVLIRELAERSASIRRSKV